jgi:hypothetical protein
VVCVVSARGDCSSGVDRVAAWLIAGIGVVYLVVAVQLLLEGKVGLGVAFIGYSIGNYGLWMAAK